MRIANQKNPLKFIQDNSSHASAIVSEWFKENEIENLSWPAQIPDINPIENI